MRTDELIGVLASNLEPVPRGEASRRMVQAMAAGLAGSLVLVWVLLGPRADMAEASRQGMFWLKLAFPLSVAVPVAMLAARVSRPGVPAGLMPLWILAPFAGVWAAAAILLAMAQPGAAAPMVLGRSWALCPVFVALASAPAMAAFLWAMKGLAPTQPALAGALAGLAAGGLGALAYSLHCDEMAEPFVAVWYSLGMAVPALAGAAVGPRLLRW